MLKKAVFKKSVQNIYSDCSRLCNHQCNARFGRWLHFNDGDVVKNALIGLAVAAVAAGASAVMNLKEGEDKDNE